LRRFEVIYDFFMSICARVSNPYPVRLRRWSQNTRMIDKG
jgi:hypothetical protein